MLVDIVVSERNLDPTMHMILGMIGGDQSVQRIGQGMYLINNFSFDMYLGSRLKYRYPFEEPCWHIDDFKTKLDAMAKLTPYGEPFMMPSFGVCDWPMQVIEQHPWLLQDPRKFVISYTLIRKEDQSDWGGWRWHKWGPYIGLRMPRYEYLYNEPYIDEVYCFHIYEVN